MKDFDTANLIDLGMDSIASAAIWEKIVQIQGMLKMFESFFYSNYLIKTDASPISPTLLYDHPGILFIKGYIFNQLCLSSFTITDIKSIVGSLIMTFDQTLNSKKYLVPTKEDEAKKFLTFFSLMSLKLAQDGKLWEDLPQGIN